MSVVKLPEGAELSLHLFIVSDKEDIEIELTVSGFPAWSDKCLERVDIAKLVESKSLPPLATDWRVMTREEIADYKRREKEHDDGDAISVQL